MLHVRRQNICRKDRRVGLWSACVLSCLPPVGSCNKHQQRTLQMHYPGPVCTFPLITLVPLLLLAVLPAALCCLLGPATEVLQLLCNCCCTSLVPATQRKPRKHSFTEATATHLTLQCSVPAIAQTFYC